MRNVFYFSKKVRLFSQNDVLFLFYFLINPAGTTAILGSVNYIRVATAQGKQRIWFLLFPDRENTGNFALTQGKILRHRENIFL